MRFIYLLLILILSLPVHAQVTIRAVILDSFSRQPLPFATIQTTDKKAVISDINGHFQMELTHHQAIHISYTGHQTRIIFSTGIGDTILLQGRLKDMETVIVRSQESRIKRIVNTAIRNRELHNPEQYQHYACNIYYKMTLDMGLMDDVNRDSLLKVQFGMMQHETQGGSSSYGSYVSNERHLLMTETFSRRYFNKPRLQETVLASRFSGLDKTFFANIVTDVLPFHLYSDYIKLNSKDYLNPVARGWQQRYHFFIEDEILVGSDTVFVLSYEPVKGKIFNALSGTVYINSNGFAITHFTGSTGLGPEEDRIVQFEQIYQLVEGKWFPAELNYDFLIKKVPAPHMKVSWNGHSIIDAVGFDQQPARVFDKTYPVKLHDSVDLRTEEEWRFFRKDSISNKELNTYRYMDSLGKNTPMGAAIRTSGKLVQGLWPIGKFDLDLTRIVAANRYEGLRLGLGLFTNDQLSKKISIGGWGGYGTRDHKWKYGASFTYYPVKAKENWIRLAFQSDYQLPGRVTIHPELASALTRGWLFQQVDRTRDWSLTSNFRAGYWELRPSVAYQELKPLHYSFFHRGKLISNFQVSKAGIGLRYAPLEKRYPFFDQYFSSGKNRLPIFYLNVNTGRVHAPGYQSNFTSVLAAIDYERRSNRWGKDYFRLEAGFLQSSNALPKSFLFAGNGFRRNQVSFYTWGGFLTMRPFDFYMNRYASLLYKHDFDFHFWDQAFSKPFVTIAHHLLYGDLSAIHAEGNYGSVAPHRGYHETGILLNQLLRYDAKFADMNINAGYFYHWTRKYDSNNGAWVLGFNFSF